MLIAEANMKGNDGMLLSQREYTKKLEFTETKIRQEANHFCLSIR